MIQHFAFSFLFILRCRVGLGWGGVGWGRGVFEVDWCNSAGPLLKNLQEFLIHSAALPESCRGQQRLKLRRPRTFNIRKTDPSQCFFYKVLRLYIYSSESTETGRVTNFRVFMIILLHWSEMLYVFNHEFCLLALVTLTYQLNLQELFIFLVSRNKH